jgi:CRISPR-associated protein Csb1
LNAGYVLDASGETKIMRETAKKKITPAEALSGESPLVLTAHFEPVAGLDRFQPAGFPEVGHVIYKALRTNGLEEQVCIVDSAASMANHLESVCLRGAHDLDLVDDLTGMPYVRCVTGTLDGDGRLPRREIVVTSLTEGHRIASTYFLEGEQLKGNSPVAFRVKAPESKANELKKEAKRREDNAQRQRGKGAKKKEDEAKGAETDASFQNTLIREFGIELPGSSKAHPLPEKWWDVFKTIFKYDPNSLVHGVLFLQWNIRIPRFLTAHLEAFGASRVDRSGVKFDRLGKTTSGQPIFSVDDATAREIRATFVLDLSLVRSFGRNAGSDSLGLTEKQKQFLVALALWKIERLIAAPFRFRSGCHLSCTALKNGQEAVELDVDIKGAIKKAGFPKEGITDVYWPREKLYREGEKEEDTPTTEGDENAEGGGDEQDANG